MWNLEMILRQYFMALLHAQICLRELRLNVRIFYGWSGPNVRNIGIALIRKHVHCKPYVWPCRKSTEPGMITTATMKISITITHHHQHQHHHHKHIIVIVILLKSSCNPCSLDHTRPTLPQDGSKGLCNHRLAFGGLNSELCHPSKWRDGEIN